MASLKDLCTEILLRDRRDLTARALHALRTATGAYKRRLPAREPTATEFLQALSYGTAETIEEYLDIRDDMPRVWSFLPKNLYTEKLLQSAFEVAEGEFRVFNLTKRFPGAIDWHNALEGVRSWPQVHWSDIPFRRLSHLGDVKLVWELNRHQFMPAIALAHVYTGDSRYAAALDRYINSWCDQNPPETGINYVSNLEIGLRSIAWIFTERILAGHGGLSDSTRSRLCRNIYAQARHLDAFMAYTKDTGRNNHLIGDAASLAFIALNFPEFQESERWLAQSLASLSECMGEQFYDDGMHFEGSFGYHLLVTELILILFCEMKHRKKPVPPWQMKVLEKMVAVLDTVRQPDGRLPNVNDCDDGYAFPFPFDVVERLEGIFAVAAILFNRADFRSAARFEMYAWLLTGEKGLEDFGILPEYPRAATSLGILPGGGFAVMRGHDGDYCIVKNNPDPFPKSGHNHADLLHMILFIGGKEILCDAGTYRYNADRDFRNALRSTFAHNTLTVDQQGQAEPHRNFGWLSMTKPGSLGAFETDDAIVCDGTHDSYFDLSVTHRRAVVYLKEYGCWIVIDRVFGEKSHHIEQYWHFPPEITVRDNRPGLYRLELAGAHVCSIEFFCEDGHDRHDLLFGSERLKWSYVSRGYGDIRTSATLMHAWEADLFSGKPRDRVTVFGTEGRMPAVSEGQTRGIFSAGDYLIDMNETPARVTRK